MIDKDQLKNELTLDEIKLLLTELGSQHIEDLSESKGHLITNTICHNISDGKLKLYYYVEARYFHCYTACGDNFDIYELVQRNHLLKGVKMSFGQAMSWICSKLGKANSGYSKPIGFQEEVKENEELLWLSKFNKKKPVVPELVVHDESIFYMFSNFHHPSFLEDYISEQAMDKFEIKYDFYRHKVVIPHRKHDTGELIGLKARSLNQEDIEKGFKYIPLKIGDVTFSYPTYANLYGFWQNKEYIKKVKKVVLFEAEKSVLQCESYYENNNFSLALCGSNMSKFQCELILSLGVEEVIIALDKENSDELDEKSIAYQQKLIKMGRMLAPYVRVFVVYDSQGLLDSKNSPSDKGKEVLEELMKQKKEIRLIS